MFVGVCVHGAVGRKRACVRACVCARARVRALSMPAHVLGTLGPSAAMHTSGIPPGKTRYIMNMKKE